MSAASVYRFDQLDEVEKELVGGWDAVRGLLGGKGANLAEMTRLGIPVPPGFTVTTQACLRYLGRRQHHARRRCGSRCWAPCATSSSGLGKRFGDPTSPLLVSCRSGAKFSMPGMMDTVLNIGLNDDTAKGLVALTGDEHFVFDSYRRLIQMFGTVVLGLRDELFENVLAKRARRAGRRQRRRPHRRRPARGRRPLPRHRRAVPDRSRRAAADGHRGGVRLVERQARGRLPQRRRHPARPRYGGQRPGDGVRQPRRALGDRRGA